MGQLPTTIVIALIAGLLLISGAVDLHIDVLTLTAVGIVCGFVCMTLLGGATPTQRDGLTR